MPIVQLSLERHDDPATHLRIGRALAPLRDEGVLIVGSGMSYHNLREFFVDDEPYNRPSEEFDRWLHDAVTSPDAARTAALTAWRSAPGAARCHPTPEHFVPLHVAAGAADGDTGRRTYHDLLLGKAVSAFQFG